MKAGRLEVELFSNLARLDHDMRRTGKGLAGLTPGMVVADDHRVWRTRAVVVAVTGALQEMRDDADCARQLAALRRCGKSNHSFAAATGIAVEPGAGLARIHFLEGSEIDLLTKAVDAANAAPFVEFDVIFPEPR